MTSVTCGGCGAALDEADGLKPEERIPCPVCGSTKRGFQVTRHAGLGVQGTASAGAIVQLTASTMIGVKATASAGEISGSMQSITAVSELLLKGVIVPGDRTAEGRLIEAVTIPWFAIIDLLKSDPHIAYEIPPYKWEEIIAGAYHKSGFDEVTLTPRSGDRGRDIIAIKKGLGSIRVIDQVKAYKPGHLVTANDVRALFGVLELDGASKGFLTTTSDFAPLLREDELIKRVIPSRLELVDGKTLFARLEELARKRNG
jgi:restriction system protein